MRSKIDKLVLQGAIGAQVVSCQRASGIVEQLLIAPARHDETQALFFQSLFCMLQS